MRGVYFYETSVFIFCFVLEGFSPPPPPDVLIAAPGSAVQFCLWRLKELVRSKSFEVFSWALFWSGLLSLSVAQFTLLQEAWRTDSQSVSACINCVDILLCFCVLNLPTVTNHLTCFLATKKLICDQKKQQNVSVYLLYLLWYTPTIWNN